jgi:hypothetical protein
MPFWEMFHVKQIRHRQPPLALAIRLISGPAGDEKSTAIQWASIDPSGSPSGPWFSSTHKNIRIRNGAISAASKLEVIAQVRRQTECKWKRSTKIAFSVGEGTTLRGLLSTLSPEGTCPLCGSPTKEDRLGDYCSNRYITNCPGITI